MRVLVISDIHANLTALDSVLADAGAVDSVWCLGDVVGYGPDPNECVARLRELPSLTCLKGNHDAAAVGDLALDSFNAEARSSIEWLRGAISEDSTKFLHSLQSRSEVGGVTLAHASPRQPILEYLLDTFAAGENFDAFDTEFCFVGHTHVPVLFFQGSHGVGLQIPHADITFQLDSRCIANPGSVGQPRDRDPRASYAIFDGEAKTWEYHRVPYDIPAVQARMLEVGLPERHIARLAGGW
jgi:diadenosine tetraphosphatase ApaH/serine/threonine PP2A family protein phosphatase